MDIELIKKDNELGLVQKLSFITNILIVGIPFVFCKQDGGMFREQVPLIMQK